MVSDHKALDQQIEQLAALFRSAKAGQAHWSDLWSLKKQIHADFRETKYPTVQERSQAWDRNREIIERIKQQEDEADRLRAEEEQHQPRV